MASDDLVVDESVERSTDIVANAARSTTPGRDIAEVWAKVATHSSISKTFIEQGLLQRLDPDRVSVRNISVRKTRAVAVLSAEGVLANGGG